MGPALAPATPLDHTREGMLLGTAALKGNAVGAAKSEGPWRAAVLASEA